MDGWVGPPQGLDSLFFPTILAPLYYYGTGMVTVQMLVRVRYVRARILIFMILS